MIDPGERRRSRRRRLHRRRQDRGDRRRAGRLRADRVIDATGLVVAPGLIDLSRAAARAGLRIQGDARIGDAGGDRRRRHQPRLPARHRSAARRAGPGRNAASTARGRSTRRTSIRSARSPSSSQGETLTEMGELTEAGCVAFSQADAPLADTQVLLARDAVRVDVRLSASGCAPQDACLARGGVAHDGEVATRLGLPGIPAIAETIALATILALVRDTGVRVHLCRLSTRRRRRAGARREARRPAGHLRRRRPPPAPVRRRHRLVRSALPPRAAAAQPRATATRCARASPTARSTALCSDHAPVDDDGKQVPFGEAEPGATGLELLLPLTLKWAAEDARAARRRRSRGSRASRPQILGVEAGASRPSARPPTFASSIRDGPGRSSAARCAARARTRRSSGWKCRGGCASRWSAGRSSTRAGDPRARLAIGGS